MFNHLGSTKNSDSGDDAAYIAEALGKHVIAVNRPHSGWELPVWGRSLVADYIGAMSKLLSKRVLPEVENLGLSGVVVFGRSAAGHGALAATRTEQLPVRGVHAQEPVGWQDLPWAEARRIFTDYRAHESQRKESDDPDLIRAESSGLTGLAKWLRERANNVRGGLDVINYQRVWRTRSSYDNTLAIARGQPDVHLNLVFAEDTYVLGHTNVDALQRELSTARIAHGSFSAAPATAEVIAHTTHSSFDLRSFSAGLLEKTVQNVLAE